jgi:hypothetical protein
MVVGVGGTGPADDLNTIGCPTLAIVVEKNLKTFSCPNAVAKTEAPTNAPTRKTKPTADRIARR